MLGNSNVSYTDPTTGTSITYPIYRPTVQNFYVQVTFYSSSIGSDLQQSIQDVVVADALGQLENPRIGLAQTIYADRFRAAIYTITNLPVQSIQIAINEASGWTDVLQINADIEPAITSENVLIVQGGS